MLGCETPGQSLVVLLVAGTLAGLLGLGVGLGPVAVALLAGALALVGEVGAHTVRGDEQWQAAMTTLFGGTNRE